MEKEILRQAFHLMLGLVLVSLISFDLIAYEYFPLYLYILMLLGLIVSLVSRKMRLPLIGKFLEIFDRDKDLKKFPGKGPFFYIAGVFFSTLLFDKAIASASILILAFGDSISHIVGKYYGRTKMLIHPEKLLEGTLAGVLCATIAASFFVGIVHAFIASSIAMFFEALELEYLKLDDNFTIPIIASAVLHFL